MKRTLALILALVMTMALVACGGDKPTITPSSTPGTSTPTTPSNPTTSAPTEKPAEDPDAKKYGGDLMIGTGNATSSMDIQMTGSSLGNAQWGIHVFEQLVVMDANGKVYGELADYEQSADGLKYTFTLKDDRYFSNGKKVTMEDVEASIRRVVSAFTTSGHDKVFGGSTVTFTDKGMTVEFEKYNINFLNSFSNPTGSYKIMPKEICEKYPVEGATMMPSGLTCGGDSKKINEIGDVIGTGPYVLTEWSDNAEVILTRNESYVPVTEGNEDAIGMAATKKAYCDTITFSYNKDSSSRTAAMMAHEYHIAGVDAAMKDAALALGITMFDAGTTWTHGIFFNLDATNADSPIADVNVRKAIRASLDVNSVMLAILKGDQSRVNLDPYAVRKETVYASTKMEDSGEWNIADLTKAKAYLAQSSYDGTPIVYLVHASGNFYNAAMAVVPAMESIGLKVDLMVVENGSHSAMRKDPATGHDIGCWEVQQNAENPVLHSTFVTGTQGWWSSPAKDAAISIMKSTPTGSPESLAAYNDYLDAVIDECPYILFGHPTGLAYRWPEVVHEPQGQNNYYYWNTYFVD